MAVIGEDSDIEVIVSRHNEERFIVASSGQVLRRLFEVVLMGFL